MHRQQYERLATSFALSLSPQEAMAIIARAYGYESYNLESNTFGQAIPGLQRVKEPTDILKEDTNHQMMEFMRMALNLSLPGLPEVRSGNTEKNIVSIMWGFSNFDALVNYAKSDPVDPSSTNKEMLAKFRKRFGYYSPIQSLLGRGLHQHNLILHDNQQRATRYIDQEIALNPLEGTKVAVVRTSKSGDAWLNLQLRNHKVYRGELTEHHSSSLLGAADDKTDVFVSIIPQREYKLSDLVAAHVNALAKRSPYGRALIIDGVQISVEEDDLEKAVSMATENGINLVLTSPIPDYMLWSNFGIRTIFGFPAGLNQSNPEMDKVLVFSSPYIGLKKTKMQYVYHSEETGARYAAMDLIPDSESDAKILSAQFSDLRG